MKCVRLLLLLCLFSGFVFCLSSWGDEASWYSVESCLREGTSGVWTASGERFDENAMTCAMRSRNFGKYFKVTNIKNGKSVIVRHNDFGPNKKLWNKGRRIDLSRGAFEKIENLTKGIVNIKIEPIASH